MVLINTTGGSLTHQFWLEQVTEWSDTALNATLQLSIVTNSSWDTLRAAHGDVQLMSDFAVQHLKTTTTLEALVNNAASELTVAVAESTSVNASAPDVPAAMSGLSAYSTAIATFDAALASFIPRLRVMQPPSIANVIAGQAGDAGAGSVGEAAVCGLPDTAPTLDAAVAGVHAALLAFATDATTATPNLVTATAFADLLLQLQSKLETISRAAFATLAAADAATVTSLEQLQPWISSGNSTTAIALLSSTEQVAMSTVVPAMAASFAAMTELQALAASATTALDAVHAQLPGVNKQQLVDSVLEAIGNLGASMPEVEALFGHTSDATQLSTQFGVRYAGHYEGKNHTQGVATVVSVVTNFLAVVGGALNKARLFRAELSAFAGVVGDIPVFGPIALGVVDFIQSLIDKALSSVGRLEDVIQRATTMPDIDTVVGGANAALEKLAVQDGDAQAATSDGALTTAALEAIWRTAHDMPRLAIALKSATAAIEALVNTTQCFNDEHVLTVVPPLVDATNTMDGDVSRATSYAQFLVNQQEPGLVNIRQFSESAAATFSSTIDAVLAHDGWLTTARGFIASDVGAKHDALLLHVAAILEYWPTLKRALAVQRCVPGVECARDRLVMQLLELRDRLAGVALPVNKLLAVSNAAVATQSSAATTELDLLLDDLAAFVTAQSATSSTIDSAASLLSGTVTEQQDAVRVATTGDRFTEYITTDLTTLQESVGFTLRQLVTQSVDVVQRTGVLQISVHRSRDIVDHMQPSNSNLKQLMTDLHTQHIPAVQLAMATVGDPAFSLADFEFVAVPARIFARFNEPLQAISTAVNDFRNTAQRVSDTIVGFVQKVIDFVDSLSPLGLKEGSPVDVAELAPVCNETICMQVFNRSSDAYRDVVFPVRYLRFCDLSTPALISNTQVCCDCTAHTAHTASSSLLTR